MGEKKLTLQEAQRLGGFLKAVGGANVTSSNAGERGRYKAGIVGGGRKKTPNLTSSAIERNKAERKQKQQELDQEIEAEILANDTSRVRSIEKQKFIDQKEKDRQDASIVKKQKNFEKGLQRKGT